MATLTPEERSVRGQLGAHEKWAKVKDRSKATEPARRALDRKFERQVLDEHGDLEPDELAFRVEHAKKAYYLRLALASAKARRLRKKAS